MGEPRKCSLTPAWPHPTCCLHGLRVSFAQAPHVPSVGTAAPVLIHLGFAQASRSMSSLLLGPGLGSGPGTVAPHCASAPCLCLPLPLPHLHLPPPQGSPTMQPWQQQARANVGGRGGEQQPWAPTWGFQRLEEDRAWEEEGPSGATQAFGTKASTSKGHSWTSPLGESEVG